MPRVFAYIITTVAADYQLTGCVPWFEGGRVFFGPCKKKMRPCVSKGDYIMGISPSGVGNVRRVLLWMRAGKPMTFAKAYHRGHSEQMFNLVRGTAIHVRPRRVVSQIAGNPESYEHIPGAPHSSTWPSDIRGNRDCFIVGDRGAWVAGNDGQIVTQQLVDLLREGIAWRGIATVQNPLTENARGKHVCLTGKAAQAVIAWVRSPTRISRSSQPPKTCKRKCSCE